MSKQLMAISILEDMIVAGWSPETSILDAIQFLQTSTDVANLQPTEDYNRTQRIRKLKRDLAQAGDRRDSDACDEIEAELDKLRGYCT